MLPWTLLLNCCNIIYGSFGSFKHSIFFLLFSLYGCWLSLIVALMMLHFFLLFYDLWWIFHHKQIIRFLTSMHSCECWMGLRKKVPSTNGYRSYTNIISLHKMHVMCVFLWAARDERTNILVSSFPCFPSSSIWNGEKIRLEIVEVFYENKIANSAETF